jgi:hypothetical protein
MVAVQKTIRITCHHKRLEERQVIARTGFRASLVSDPQVSYRGKNQEFRVLCGSIQLLLDGPIFARRTDPDDGTEIPSVHQFHVH